MLTSSKQEAPLLVGGGSSPSSDGSRGLCAHHVLISDVEGLPDLGWVKLVDGEYVFTPETSLTDTQAEILELIKAGTGVEIGYNYHWLINQTNSRFRRVKDTTIAELVKKGFLTYEEGEFKVPA